MYNRFLIKLEIGSRRENSDLERKIGPILIGKSYYKWKQRERDYIQSTENSAKLTSLFAEGFWSPSFATESGLRDGKHSVLSWKRRRFSQILCRFSLTHSQIVTFFIYKNNSPMLSIMKLQNYKLSNKISFYPLKGVNLSRVSEFIQIISLVITNV